jgi:uncharacterized membrane protein
MEILVVLIGLLFIFGPYILSGVLLTRVSRVESNMEAARKLLGELETANAAQAEEIAALRREIRGSGATAPVDATFETVETAAAPAEEIVEETDEAYEAEEADTDAVLPPGPALGERIRGWLSGGGLERQFGAVLPVWIGGIALAFAGFFMVKYSIENALVGPTMRVILGGLLGGGLIAAAHWIGYRSRVESAERIAQSLAGAGIAVLYVASYAAGALYDLVPPAISFMALAGVTAIAVVLSLRHGAPIALLGLLGGFLTPALVRSDEPSAMVLFVYLYIVFAAVMILVRRKNWWPLALPAVLLSFLWVATWMASDAFRPDQVIWAGLFLAGVAGTIVAASRERYSAEMAAAGSWRGVISLRNQGFLLNTVAVAGAFALFAFLAFSADFAVQDWLLFGVLAVGAVALAYFEPRLYGYVPWAAMAVNLVMLAGWEPETLTAIAVAVTAFGALYVASGLLLFSGATYPVLWATLAAASGVGYYLLGYYKLGDGALSEHPEDVPLPQHGTAPVLPDIQPLGSDTLPGATTPGATPPAIDTPPNMQPVEPLAEGVRQAAHSIPYLWGAIAFALALLFFGAALRATKTLSPGPVKDRVLAAFALATTAFVALGLTVELPGEFLSVAIAAELLAVVWVAGRTQIASLRPIAALLGAVFAFLLFPQLLLLVQLAFYSLFVWRIYLEGSIPLVDYPLFQLALPAVFFLVAAYLLRRQAADGWFVRTLEASSVALLGLWGFYTASKLFHPGENVLFAEAGFLERGVITNVLFAFGLGCLIAGRMFERRAFAVSGGALVFIALFRIVYFDLFLKNPIWFHAEVPGVPLFNALAITFGLPILWIWLASREPGLASYRWFARLPRWIPGLMLVLGFAWLSFEIRRLYQGPFLDRNAMSDAELWSYSVAWLVFGLALLFFGTLRGNQMLRFASLAVMLVTVSKVFLIDAGSLTGLYRVFSFLGLGLSLLGLSYFYSRFVFGGEAPPEEPPATPQTSSPA